MKGCWLIHLPTHSAFLPLSLHSSFLLPSFHPSLPLSVPSLVLLLLLHPPYPQVSTLTLLGYKGICHVTQGETSTYKLQVHLLCRTDSVNKCCPFLPPGSSLSLPDKPLWSPCIPPTSAQHCSYPSWPRVLKTDCLHDLEDSLLRTYIPSYSDLLTDHLSSWDRLLLPKPLTSSLAFSTKSCFHQSILSYSDPWLVVHPATPQGSPPSYLVSRIYMMLFCPMSPQTMAGVYPPCPGWTEKSTTLYNLAQS